VAQSKLAAGNKNRFVAIIIGVAVIGVGVLGYLLSTSSPRITTIDAKSPAGASEPHVIGNPNAPVQVIEFADFECPACGAFANLQEPDIRARLVNTGIVTFKFYDFPITGLHRNTLYAHNAAACADDQGKFWEMHDRLFAGQDEWSQEVTRNPMKVLSGYAKDLGLDIKTWENCVLTQKHLSRIAGNLNEGTRRNIAQTPTFVIGDKQVAGSLNFDEFKTLVDSALARNKASAPVPAPAKKGASK
jgi:protein-disulfide isomerase